MVIVPDLVTDTPPLARNPVFLYYSDRFTRPQVFHADIVVSIDDVLEKKINMLGCACVAVLRVAAWTAGQVEQVPKDPAERKKWLAAGPLAARNCNRSGGNLGEALRGASHQHSTRRGVRNHGIRTSA